MVPFHDRGRIVKADSVSLPKSVLQGCSCTPDRFRSGKDTYPGKGSGWPLPGTVEWTLMEKSSGLANPQKFVRSINTIHKPNHRKDEKTMKRNASRILSLVLAIALIMSMSLTAFAMDGHEMYMSPAAGTSYTTMVDAATNTVNLEVFFTAYNDGNYYNTGFDSDEQAAAVTWTVSNNDAGLINGDVAVSAGSNNGYKTSKGTVTLNAGVSGVAVVHAAHNGLTLDLVIARDAAGSQSSVKTKVYVVDVTASENKCLVGNEEVTVYAPAENGGSLMTGKAGAFQKQPTAMGTLDALLTEGFIDSATLSADGSYVSEINELEYWSYAVYNTSTGALVDITQNISASIYALSSGQTVVWKYGAWSFASNLNTEIASW